MVIEVVLLAIFLFYVHLNYTVALLSSLTFKSSPPSAKKKLPKVSVIIATKNEENAIEATLRAVRRSNYPKDKLEIIVVDSSTDNTAKIAKKHADKLIVDRKARKAAALNIGVKAANGDVLYLLDGDSLVERDTIKNVVSTCSDYPACTGIILRGSKGALSAGMGRMQNIFLFFSVQTWLQRFVGTSFVAGRNYAINKKDLLGLGGFHDVVGEDVNLSYRLYQERRKVCYLSGAEIYEGGPVNLKSFWRQQERWYSGLSHEVRKAYGNVNIYDSLILLPMIVSLIASYSVSIILLAIFALTGNYIFLSGTILGFLVTLHGATKFLSMKDILMLPVTFLFYGIFQLLIFSDIFIKRLLNIEIKWRKPVEGIS